MSKKITIQTIPSIDFTAWIEQAKRFAKIDDVVSVRNMPLDTDTSKHASIEVEFDKLLSLGFEGTVTYKQHYTKTEPYQEYDDVTLEPIGDPVDRQVDATHTIVKYKQKLTATEVEYLLEQADKAVPVEVTGRFARENYAISLIVMQEVVDNYTFNLKKEDWQIIS